MAQNVHHMQVIVDVFSEAAKHFGLTSSVSKTEVLLQPAPATRPQKPCITIDGTQLKNVESVKYLGSIISNDGTLDREITTRMPDLLPCVCLRLWTSEPHACPPLTLVHFHLFISTTTDGFQPSTHFSMCFVNVILGFERQPIIIVIIITTVNDLES